MLDYEYLTRFIRGRAALAAPDFYRFVKKSYLIKAFLLCPFILLPNLTKSKKKIFFSSPHAYKQVSPAERGDVCLIGGPVEFMLALKSGSAFINAAPCYITLALSLFTPIKIKALSEFFFRRLFRTAELINDGPGLLVHHSDALPFGRFLNLYFQKNNFNTICFQHGYFDGSVFETDGFYSDFNVAINRQQIKVLKNSIPHGKFLFTYSDISICENIFCANRKGRYVLLGEGWKSHNFEIHKKYINYIKKLRKVLNSNGIISVYRPHPSEKFDFLLLYKMLPLMFNRRGEGLNCKDTYIGSSSSLLAEAANLGANSISINDLTPKGGVRHPLIKRLCGDVFLKNHRAILRGKNFVCLGHKREFVSIEKLFLQVKSFL